MSGPVTLGDLIEGKKLLWVYCCDCGHERDVDPASLPLSWNTPVPLIGTHMKCAACGSHKINTKPVLYPGGVAACEAGGISGACLLPTTNRSPT